MNTAVSALLITLAEPLQVAVALLLAPVAMLAGRGRINKDFGVYPYVELDEAEKRYDWCLSFYGPSHQQTTLAREQVATVATKYKDLFIKDGVDIAL